ncbi:MAG: amidase [Pseudomonadota bacterium]
MSKSTLPAGRVDASAAPQESLAAIAARIAAPEQRQKMYADLTARRDAVEPAVNAFEMRRERCPETVRGPLNGLPITVKDQIAVTGWPTSHGKERASTRPEQRSASLVARLQSLGANVTGKTALPPHAMDFQTVTARRGATANPHNPAFTPGGSTGGGAAAVASGMSYADVGSDLSGSLRIPASWCGVASYTPTEGAWPTDGMLPATQKLAHFARIGLTARTAADLSFLWHRLERTAPRVPDTPPRIAVWQPGKAAPCDADTSAAWTRFAEDVHRCNPGAVPDAMTSLFRPEIYRIAAEIIGHETGGLIPWVIRWLMRQDRQARDTSPGFVAHVHEGYRRDKTRYAANLRKLDDLRRAALDIWGSVDALMVPVSGVCAFRHTAPVRDQGGVRTYDTVFQTAAGPMRYFDALTRFTLPITALGWPVVTVPIGRDSNGIPIGVQLVGKPGADGAMLQLAQQVEASHKAESG